MHLIISRKLISIVNLMPNLKCLELWLTCKKLYPTVFVHAPSGNSWKLLYEEAHLTLNVLLLYCWKEIHSPVCQQRFNSITLFNEDCLYKGTINLKSSEMTDIRYCLLLLLLNAPTSLSELFSLGFKNLLCGKIGFTTESCINFECVYWTKEILLLSTGRKNEADYSQKFSKNKRL